MTTDEHNLAQARAVIAELRRHGVTKFVICPGSRSAPLVLALSSSDGVDCVVHHDERGAGFYAVGYARAGGRPAAVVTTSGTAAVNLFPAIVEASQDNLPLIALTADRPPELHGVGANQTIEQTHLFGKYVRYFADLPCPGDGTMEESVRAVKQAIAQSKRGPVHLNCRYREPLVPPPERIVPPAPYASPAPPAFDEPGPGSAELSEIVKGLREAARGLALVGHLGSDDERHAAASLIARLGWPTLTDITSGLGSVESPPIVALHDLILASGRFTDSHRPDVVLHVGGRLTSKRLLQFLADSRPPRYILNAGRDLVYDPVGAVTERTAHDTASFCRRLAEQVSSPVNDSWRDSWRAASARAAETVASHEAASRTLTEPAIALALSRHLPPDAGLFLSSSMPVRDLNTFARFGRILPVASNRGASGIDGTVASASGFADGLDRPVTLLIGDQAFLHDLSSLTLLASSSRPVTVIIVNNRGGRIFESLPVAAHAAALDRFFVNRHRLAFEHLASGFGLRYELVDDIACFRSALERSAVSETGSIIEASVDPAASREHRNRTVAEAAATIDLQIGAKT